MKWNKFQEISKQHPYLADTLVWRGTCQDTKEFVRKKVGFIAFRPFEKLDLSATQVYESSPLKSKYIYAKMECYKGVEYQIVFHIEGEAEGSRLHHVTFNEIGDNIQAHINEVIRWFKGCDVFSGKQIIWERVVKRTVKGSSYAGLTEMNLEIYQFPQGYHPESENEAKVA